MLGAQRIRVGSITAINIDEETTPYKHIYTVSASDTSNCSGTFPLGNKTSTAFGGAFDLIVSYVANRVAQTLQDNGTGRIWWRYFANNSGWSNWYRVSVTEVT